MFRKNISTILIFSLLSIYILLLSSCTKESIKIPITTNSEKAKEVYIKGLSLSDRLRGQEAVKYFEDAIALDSNFAMAYIGLAFADANPNHFFANIQKAMSLKNKVSDGERLWIEAVDAQVNNQTIELRSILKKLIDLYPDDERAYNFMGTAYFATQEYKEAIKYYLEALKINPDYSPVYNQLGYAYRYLKNFSEAEKMFQKYIELIPNDPNPYDSYGELLMEIGKFDESIANYKKALSVNPYFTFSYLGIASNLNYKDEHVQARNILQKLLISAKNDNQKRIAYNGIIISYIDEGNLAAALKTTNEMRQLAIDASDTITIANEYIPLGILYLEMGKLSEAEDLFNRTIQLTQNSNFSKQVKINAIQNISVDLAIVDIKRGKYEVARKKAENFFVYASDQDNPNLLRLAYQLYGMIALAEKEYETAIEYLRKSDQNNPYNIYRIALAYESLGDTERANSFFSKAAHANLVSNRNYSYIREKALKKIHP